MVEKPKQAAKLQLLRHREQRDGVLGGAWNEQITRARRKESRIVTGRRIEARMKRVAHDGKRRAVAR